MPEDAPFEQTFSVTCACTKWPPDFSGLSSLGFDSIAVSSREAVVKKVQSADLIGKPRRFVEIRIRKGKILFKYSCPKGSDPQIRRLHATLLLLRVLRLLPHIKADMPSLSEFLLPPLELSELLASQPYEALLKKHADLETDFADLSLRNKRMMRTAEAEAARMLELESATAALHERVRRLESVSDTALREMLLSWLSMHRGSFDVAQFSGAKKIPPARCEEGLETLLQDGTITRLGNENYLQARQKAAATTFLIQKHGLHSSVKRLTDRAARRVSSFLGKKQ